MKLTGFASNSNQRSAFAANCLDKVATFVRDLPDMKTNIRRVLITLAPMCIGLLSKANAVVPAPDGGYPGFNTAEGQKALFHLSSGTGNTAIGWFSLESVTAGSFNTGVGAATLVLNTGDENTATGAGALLLNTTGSLNTANGAFALLNNSTGSFNTATGFQALRNNTTGDSNTANGINALGSNSTGAGNTATGSSALVFNTTGGSNTATGVGALLHNTIGGNNTANGVLALSANTTAGNNTASGHEALLSNTIGGGNTATGVSALQLNIDGNFNTATGINALLSNTSGSSNIAVGFSAGSNLTTGDNNIDIGSTGFAGESATIRIGQSGSQTRTFFAGIRGVITGNMDAIPVVIDSVGQLGTVSSSRRFKNEIKPMEQTSEDVLALRPVTFHYNTDKTNTPQFGLIAEQVAEVNPDLVVRDGKGEIYTVRYDAVNAMLLNEFIKEHRKVEQMQKQIDALTAGLQKVSAHVEASCSAQQTVAKNQ